MRAQVLYCALILLCIQCCCKSPTLLEGTKDGSFAYKVEDAPLSTTMLHVWGILLLAVIYKYCSHPLSARHRGVIRAPRDLQECNCRGSHNCSAIKRAVSYLSFTRVCLKCVTVHCKVRCVLELSYIKHSPKCSIVLNLSCPTGSLAVHLLFV